MDEHAESEFQVDVTRQGGATIIAVSGEIDAASTPELEGSLSAAYNDADGGLVLDLSGCGFVDSTGLHAIIDARTAIERRGGRFALCCGQHGPVARVIEVALPGVLELHPTREAALSSLR